MNTEECFKKDIWWLLQELKKDEMSTARSEHIHFEYTTGENKPKVDDQRRAIRLLVVTSSINISSDVYPFPFDAMTARMAGAKPSGHLLELQKPTFDKVYELFEWATKENVDPKVTHELTELMKAETTLETETKDIRATLQKITPFFDETNGKIFINGKPVEIPLGTNQYVICKKIFDQALKEWTTETDVINNFYKDGQRSFYDAVRIINNKIKAELGIKNFLEYKASRVRIRPALIT